MSHRARLAGMIALLAGSGTLHLAAPGPYAAIVPAPLRPWRAQIVAVSGVAELLCAALLAVPRSRRAGAALTAGLLVAVFPANLQMALDAQARPRGRVLGSGALAWARLPLQVPLVAVALSLRHAPTAVHAPPH